MAETAEFARLIESPVTAAPVPYSVLAGSVQRALADPGRGAAAMWWVAEHAGRAVAAGQHLPPYPLGLQGCPDAQAEQVAPAVVDLVLGCGRHPDGVAGPEPATLAAARAWQARTGASAHVRRRTRLHVLDTLRPPSGVPGTARRPLPDEADLLVDWTTGFCVATGGEPDRAATLVADRLDGTWLWEVTGSPVAMAAHTPAAGGVARVGPVFTPVGQRGRGYGSAVTASVTRAALDAGAGQVCLYTDLANPVSNAIYARLGYVPVADELALRFGTSPVAAVAGAAARADDR